MTTRTGSAGDDRGRRNWWRNLEFWRDQRGGHSLEGDLSVPACTAGLDFRYPSLISTQSLSSLPSSPSHPTRILFPSAVQSCFGWTGIACARGSLNVQVYLSMNVQARHGNIRQHTLRSCVECQARPALTRAQAQSGYTSIRATRIRHKASSILTTTTSSNAPTNLNPQP